MKKTLSIIAVAAVMAGPAIANIGTLESAVDRHVNGADLSKLTDVEIAELRNIVYQGESFSERQLRIEAFLREADALDVERSGTFVWSDDQYTALEADLQQYGDYDIEELTQAEKMQLMAIMYSGDSMSEKDTKIRALFL